MLLILCILLFTWDMCVLILNHLILFHKFYTPQFLYDGRISYYLHNNHSYCLIRLSKKYKSFVFFEPTDIIEFVGNQITVPINVFMNLSLTMLLKYLNLFFAFWSRILRRCYPLLAQKNFE